MGFATDYKVREYPLDWNLHGMADDFIRKELERIANEVHDILPGDIGTFRFGRCDAHLGIFTGRKSFIHTNRTAGKVVRGVLIPGNGWHRHLSKIYRLNIEKLEGRN